MFQPTRPARGVTGLFCSLDTSIRVSTHTPRTGRDLGPSVGVLSAAVSTHTPRTGRDDRSECHIHRQQVSTHTPRTGRDVCL